MNRLHKIELNNVKIWLNYVIIHNNQININNLKLNKDIRITEENLDEQMLNKIFFIGDNKITLIKNPPFTFNQINIESFNNITWPHGSIEKQSIINSILNINKNIEKNIDIEIRIYPENVILVSAGITVKQNDVTGLLLLINGLLEYNCTLSLNKKELKTINEIIKQTLHKIINIENNFKIMRKYSIIILSEIVPDFFNSDEYFKDPYIKEMNGLAIRRIIQYNDIKENITRDLQKNIAFSNKDIIMINYHNCLLYVNSYPKINFYLDILRIILIYTTLLNYYHERLFKKINNINFEDDKINILKRHHKDLDNLLFSVYKVLQTYDIIYISASTRSRMLIHECTEKMNTNEITDSIKDKILTLEDLINKQYSISISNRLQYIAIILAIIALILTFIGLT